MVGPARPACQRRPRREARGERAAGELAARAEGVTFRLDPLARPQLRANLLLSSSEWPAARSAIRPSIHLAGLLLLLLLLFYKIDRLSGRQESGAGLRAPTFGRLQTLASKAGSLAREAACLARGGPAHELIPSAHLAQRV